jgi:hypothetical protein
MVGVLGGGLDQLDSDLMSGFGANLFGGDAESELDGLDAAFLGALRSRPATTPLDDDEDDGSDLDLDDDGLDLLDDEDGDDDEEATTDLFEE